jgi:malate synthase
MEEKPIANKYCEGKVKRALKRGLKDVKPLERKVLRLATVGGMSIGKGMRRERTKSP